MNRQEAFSAAVLGERVRAVDMPEGVFIDYQFAGWRINFPSGSSSGYTAKDHDDAVEWEVFTPPKRQGWDMSLVKPPAVIEPRRRRRSSFDILPKNDAKLTVCRCGSNFAAAYCCGAQVAEPTPAAAIVSFPIDGKPPTVPSGWPSMQPAKTDCKGYGHTGCGVCDVCMPKAQPQGWPMFNKEPGQ